LGGSKQIMSPVQPHSKPRLLRGETAKKEKIAKRPAGCREKNSSYTLKYLTAEMGLTTRKKKSPAKIGKKVYKFDGERSPSRETPKTNASSIISKAFPRSRETYSLTYQESPDPKSKGLCLGGAIDENLASGGDAMPQGKEAQTEPSWKGGSTPKTI